MFMFVYYIPMGTSPLFSHGKAVVLKLFAYPVTQKQMLPCQKHGTYW